RRASAAARAPTHPGAARGPRWRPGSAPWRLEEGHVLMAQGGHDERAVEVLIEALAGALGDEETAVAGGAFEVSIVEARGHVMGAHRIVGAQLPALPRALKMSPDATPLLDQSPEGPLGAGGPGHEQQSRHGRAGAGRRAVDALADGACGVAALERDLGHQQVGEG